LVEIGLKAKGNANAYESDAIASAATLAFQGPELDSVVRHAQRKVDRNRHRAVAERRLNVCGVLRAWSRSGAEGEREIDARAFVDRIAALADDRGSYFNSDGLPGSCIYPQQGGCD
jgi:hypothetical protein